MWMQAAILLAALLLRVHRIGVHEFWLDETFSFQDATAVHWAWDLRLRDMPPLYTVLLHYWTGVAGTDEGALRLLSALLGTLAVGATMWLARRMGGPRAVAPAGVVASLAPMHVYYSQEARPYALLLLLIPLVLGLVHRAVTHDRVRDWAPVGLVATVVLYTHYLGGLALLSSAGMLLVAPSRRVATRWVASIVVAGLLFLPWVVWSFVLVSHSTAGLGWIADAWARTAWAVPRSLEMFVIGPRAGTVPITLKQFDTLAYPESLRWLALATAAALALWLAVPVGSVRREAWRDVAALVVSMLTPLVVLLAVSFVKPIYLVGRYDMLGFPAFPVLMGLAWAKLEAAGVPRARVVLPALAAACLLPVAVKLFRYYGQPAVHPENSAAAAERLAARLATGDVVLFPDLRGHVVLYQLARRGWAWRGDECEQGASGTRVGCDVLPPAALDAAVRGDTAPLREALARALEGHPGAVFIVHGTWTVGATGPMVLPGDVAVIGELGRLGYRGQPGDWEAGITEYRRPEPTPR
jgi:4-amino-4-deoxy-L-arabinose transferase-like glycosyltransferase